MTPPPVTADICARAIIAASRSYSADPVAAYTDRTGPRRKGVTAAAVALSQELGLSPVDARRIIGVSHTGYNVAISRGGRPFEQAVMSARKAIRRAAAV